MIIRKRAKDTLTAVEMNEGDTLEFTLVSGQVMQITLLHTEAEVIRTTLAQLTVEEKNGRTDYRFRCRLTVDGVEHVLEREVATQRSFYEPWELGPVRLWFDAVDKIFDFLHETHGPCRTKLIAKMPRVSYAHARFAIQDATLGICPEPLHPWCPLPEGGLSIQQCYRGEDCWLGAYNGLSAHGGLDINHPAGTPLWAPIDLDTQFYRHTVALGAHNNAWCGIRRWANGAEWILRAAHMTALTVPERQPVAQGQQFAWGAGVHSGAVEHSHFVFCIHDDGETTYLDPWILIWQMYRDQHLFDVAKTTDRTPLLWNNETGRASIAEPGEHHS